MEIRAVLLLVLFLFALPAQAQTKLTNAEKLQQVEVTCKGAFQALKQVCPTLTAELNKWWNDGTPRSSKLFAVLEVRSVGATEYTVMVRTVMAVVSSPPKDGVMELNLVIRQKEIAKVVSYSDDPKKWVAEIREKFRPTPAASTNK